MFDRSGDVENESSHSHDQDGQPILTEPQLNVGGHGLTQRRLRNYHVTMIGLCSGIGTGLFIGTGAAYANAGPAGLLLAYIIVGSVLWAVMQSIAELATVVSILTFYLRFNIGLLECRFLLLDHSLTLLAVLSTLLLDFHWLLVMVTAIRYPSRRNAQLQPSLSVTGPIYHQPSSSPSVSP